MNAISYNMRGCDSLLKRKRFSQLMKKEKFDFFLIQETKLQTREDKWVFELWGGTDME